MSKELLRESAKESNNGIDIDILYRRILAKKKIIQ